MPVPTDGAAELSDRLRSIGCVAAEAEAAEMLAATTDRCVLDAWVARRRNGEPLPWITGRTRFCGRDVFVDPGVYVPRPQSEELARRAAELLPAAGIALDLCTGTGAIAAHLAPARPGATVVATDVDPAAVRCARRNGVIAVVADLAAPLRSRSVDVVTAVAPYVPAGALGLLPPDVLRHEPHAALGGGIDGLDVVRRVIDDASRVLRPGGWLVTEIGGEQDGPTCRAMADAGFERATTWCDADGETRGVLARLRGTATTTPRPAISRDALEQ